MARPVTEVAVGVVLDADGSVLLADRPAGKPYAGYWEFPGGKVEPGEGVAAALARELAEELALLVDVSLPWVVYEHDYPHAHVRLHFRRVFDWRGEARGLEGQRLRFADPGQAPPSPLLPAALPAWRWLQLPTVHATRGAPPAGDTAQALAWLDGWLGRGLRQLVWHQPLLAGRELEAATRAAAARARAYGCRLLVDGAHPRPLWDLADGVVLDAAGLRGAQRRPDVDWVGAIAGERADLEAAAALGCDFAVAAGAGAAGLCEQAPLPVYALDEWSVAALGRAQAAGAQGLAVALA